MILASVGTQLPFPRLNRALDAFAQDHTERVLAQIGPDPSIYNHLETFDECESAVFEGLCRDARVIVAHAGIGTVLQAARFRKPIIIVPRKCSLGEHRNDHQLASAHQLSGRPGIYVAWETRMVRHFLLQDDLVSPAPSNGTARRDLNDFVSNWIKAAGHKRS